MPLFTKPIAFIAALMSLRARKLVPTALSTADLQELDAGIRRRALFSARLTQLGPLQALAKGLDDMLAGKASLADALLLMSKTYEEMGYEPETGFKQDAPGTVPPARKGSLTDLSSDKRQRLTITTNYRIAANTAYVTKGNTPIRLFMYPAYELIRIGRRRTPRGYVRIKGGMKPKLGDDWQSRFLAAGGELFDKGTRMIAAKDSPVWQALGDGLGGYKDTLGNPFPPFAFGSGYGIKEVHRDECLLLGVIQPDEKIAKMPASLEGSLKTEADKINPEILKALGKDLEKREDGTVRLRRQREEEFAKAQAAAKEAERAKQAAYEAARKEKAEKKAKSVRNSTAAVLSLLNAAKPVQARRKAPRIILLRRAAA